MSHDLMAGIDLNQPPGGDRLLKTLNAARVHKKGPVTFTVMTR